MSKTLISSITFLKPKRSCILIIVIILIAISDIKAQIPTNGLVAWYSFAGNAYDSTGNGNDGVVYGASLTVDRFGKSNAAYSFNGTNSYIKIPNSTTLQNITSLTISTWVNINSWYNNGGESFFPILHKSDQQFQYGQYALNLKSTGAICHLNTKETGLSYSSWGLNSWIHVVFILTTDSTTFYVNGTKIFKAAAGVFPNSTNTNLPLIIGCDYLGLAEYSNGKLDDIRIYNRSITDAEIQALYHEGGYATASIPSNGLVAWYPFSGNANDSSGNGNNGTVNRATLTTDRFGKANCAYSFNANDSNYISSPSNSFPTKAGTISSWVNFSGAIKNGTPPYDWSTILAYGTRGGLLVNGNINDSQYNKFLQNFVLNNSPTSNSAITQNVWTHVVETIDGLGNCTFYFNSVNVGGGKISNFTPASLNGVCNIGKSNNDLIYPWYFNGKLDDIRIYNRALDSSEIYALYREGGYNGNTLPVMITNIVAINKENNVEVNWHTTTELNISHFSIQHSTDGTSFTDISTVKAIGSGANSYSFTDNNPINTPVLYYRLGITDKDGKVTYSQAVLVTLKRKSTISLSPNPTHGLMTVQLKTNVLFEDVAIFIYDLKGKNVFQRNLKLQRGNTSLSLNISYLQKGLYHLKVSSNIRNEILKFIKD